MLLLLHGAIIFQLTRHALGDNNYVRYLTTTWDGETFPPNGEVEIPVILSLGSKDEKNVQINFTSRAIHDKENNFFIPGVFGIMFKGDGNRYLHVEAESTGSSSIKIYDGFQKMLQPEESMQIIYELRDTNLTWNGTIDIPVEYFPRGTNELAAYANFTEAPNNNIIVLTLTHISTNKTHEQMPPNLHKQSYFSGIRMHTYLPKANFDQWSPMWQHLLNVLPGGTPLHPDAAGEHVHHENSTSNQKLAKILLLLIIAFQLMC